MSKKVIFMGTPDFALPILEALHESTYEVVGLFCQPDKAKGRGKKIQMPPTKEYAVEQSIPVFQPTTFHDEAVKKTIASLNADIIVVVAYGKIVPKWVLESTPYGCLNIHGSLLPKYRGAAPIQYAVLNGDRETGITFMQMNEQMDEGPILRIVKEPIHEDDTSGTLFDRLAALGSREIVPTLDALFRGELQPKEQDHDQATYTQKITKDMGAIDWTQDGESIDCLVRAMQPWPGAYTYLNGKRIKIWKGAPLKEFSSGDLTKKHKELGTVLGLIDTSMIVVTGDGFYKIMEVQPDNKRRMSIFDYEKGNPIESGTICTRS